MRSRKKLNKRKIFIAAVFTAIIIITVICIDIKIKNKIEQISIYYCNISVSEIINKSVSKTLNDNNTEYSDLVYELYDADNKLSSVKVKTDKLNILQTQIISDINRQLLNNSKNKIKIPLGTVSGSYLFSGRGPEIEIKFLPSGSVSSVLNSELTSAGINQSCHKISMNITADITAVFPSGSCNTSVQLNCILAESVIIGEVPDGIIGENIS